MRTVTLPPADCTDGDLAALPQEEGCHPPSLWFRPLSPHHPLLPTPKLPCPRDCSVVVCEDSVVEKEGRTCLPTTTCHHRHYLLHLF